MLISNEDHANFGWSVAGGADFNGDGLSDVLVGAPFQDIGDRTGAGMGYLFVSPFSGTTGIADATASFAVD